MSGIAGMAGTWTKDRLWPPLLIVQSLSAPKTDGTDCHCVPMYEIEERDMNF